MLEDLKGSTVAIEKGKNWRVAGDEVKDNPGRRVLIS